MASPTRSGSRARLPQVRGAEDGYTLAALAVAITVLTILLGLALPVWSKAIQREKEEELIARGLQYAEAIRVFRGRFNRLPVRLEELLEVKPRSIRQLFKDPMTEDGRWALVFEGGGPANQPPGANPNPSDPNGRGAQEGRQLLDLPQTGPDGRPIQAFGPIAGVHSTSDKEAMHVWNGKEKINEWIFDYNLLSSGGQPFGTPNAQGGSGVNPFTLHAMWLGRPFREGLVPPGQGVPPGGTGPGGKPGGGFGTGGGKPSSGSGSPFGSGSSKPGAGGGDKEDG
jgi:type II secretory pathway pseudopilin PulG